MKDKLVDIGMVMTVSGFIFGIWGCGLLANNELNSHILIGFGCLFGVGLIIWGVGLMKRRFDSRR